MNTSDIDFGRTIDPVGSEVFFRDYFERKHLVVNRQQQDYFSSLLPVSEIDRAITSTGMIEDDLQVVNARSEIAPRDYVYPNGFIDLARVYQLYADGGTIILPSLQTRVPALAEFCRALEATFSARIQTNVYLTPSDSQGFRAHYDSHDVLVLQVAGSKEWRIYDTPVELPLRDQGFSPEVAIGDETDRFVLHAGDVAYIPRGLAHDAVATGEVSLHITTGLMMRSWIDLALDAVGALAREEVGLRHALPPGFAAATFERGAAAAHFQALLETVAERADFGAALDRFADEFVATRPPLVAGQMAQIEGLTRLDGASEAGARPNLIYRIDTAPDAEKGAENGAERLVVRCHGNEMRLPAHARAALEHALTAPRFRVRDLPGDMNEAGKVVLVRRLIREGLVTLRR